MFLAFTVFVSVSNLNFMVGSILFLMLDKRAMMETTFHETPEQYIVINKMQIKMYVMAVMAMASREKKNLFLAKSFHMRKGKWNRTS